MRSGVGGVKNHDSKTLQFRPVFLESGELSSQERGLKRTQTDSEGKGLFSFLTFALCQFCSISFRVQVGRVFFFFRVVGCSATSVTLSRHVSQLFREGFVPW